MKRKALSRSLNPHKQPLSSLYQRKMDELDLSKTIDTSIPELSKMLIHYPELMILLINFEEKHFSSKWTYDGDTTTFESDKETNGKQLSFARKASTNLKSCSLDSATHLPPSNQ